MYWGFDYKPGMSTDMLILTINAHGMPFLFLLVDLCMNSFCFPRIHFIFILVVGFFYGLINVVYTLKVRPIYDILDWQSWFSGMLLAGALFLAFVMFLMCRILFHRLKKNKFKSDRLLLNYKWYKLSSLWLIVLHHGGHHFLPFFFEVFSLQLFLFLFSFLVHCAQQHPSFLLLLELSHPRVWILICPSDGDYFIVVKCLVCHAFLCEFRHASMPVFDERIALMGKNVYILHLSPKGKVSQQDFVKLCDSVIVVWKLIVTHINSPCFLCKRTYSLHVFPESAEPSPSKNVFCLINQFTVFQGWHTMIPVTFDPICTASPCIEQTEICSISFIQKIGCCVPSIEFRIASGFGCLFFFFVLSTNVLAVPIVIFLISFLVGVFVGDTGLDLLPSRGFTDARKL